MAAFAPFPSKHDRSPLELRTHRARLESSARKALSLLLVPPRAGDKHGPVKPAIEFFDQMEIYPGKSTPPPDAALRASCKRLENPLTPRSLQARS